MQSEKIRAKCPSCGKIFPRDETSPWRPFCSERCRLIDLGDWLDGSHRIPDNDQAPPFTPREES